MRLVPLGSETDTAPAAFRIWWASPSLLLLGVLLPAFLLSSYLGAPMMPEFGSVNFLDGRILLLGAVCIVAAALGGFAGERLGRLFKPGAIRPMDRERVELVIAVLGIISIAAHIIYIGQAILDPTKVIEALHGQEGAMYAAEDQVHKLAGITSFTQLYLLSLPLTGAYSRLYDQALPKHLRFITGFLLVMVVLRAVIARERFAIIEAGMAFALPWLSYRRKQAFAVSWYPLIGSVAVFALFAFGEYTRSWGFYKDRYPSLLQFAALRLLAYLATANNNAAGMIQGYDSLSFPYFTFAGLWKLPIWSHIGVQLPTDPLISFFESYGNDEFNNPGGVLSGVIDFGIVPGVVYYIVAGIIGGISYAMFLRRQAIGLLLFPLVHIGFLILNQLIYWGNQRVYPALLVMPFVLAYIQRPSPTVLWRLVSRTQE